MIKKEQQITAMPIPETSNTFSQGSIFSKKSAVTIITAPRNIVISIPTLELEVNVSPTPFKSITEPITANIILRVSVIFITNKSISLKMFLDNMIKSYLINN